MTGIGAEEIALAGGSVVVSRFERARAGRIDRRRRRRQDAVYFLGARPAVLAEALRRRCERYPRLAIASRAGRAHP